MSRLLVACLVAIVFASAARSVNAQGWGPDQCKVLLVFQPNSGGLHEQVKVTVHSSTTNPTTAIGLVRQAGAQGPLSEPQDVPANIFPNDVYTFAFNPPEGGWQVNVLLMFEFYVVHGGFWYRTSVVFRFNSNELLEIFDYYENSGILD